MLGDKEIGMNDRCAAAASAGRLGFRFLTAAIAGIALALASRPAAAANCGDDVGGVRVPCACGDIVVSDTRLESGDPVVSQPCPRDGLFILVPTGSPGITLDLGGLSLVGKGKGAGIRVVRGGAGGSAIVGGGSGGAQVARFDVGIRASGKSDVREVRDVELLANVGEGLALRSSGVEISNVRSTRNGGTGLRIAGRGVRATDVESAGNLGDGIKLHGTDIAVEGRSVDNRGDGARLSGRGHVLEGLESRRNGGAGVRAGGTGHRVGSDNVGGNAAGAVAGREGAVTR